MTDTKTVTVADAYERRLWEAGTLTYTDSNTFRIHDITEADDMDGLFIARVDHPKYKIRQMVDCELLDYTPAVAPKRIDTPAPSPQPDPQAEIARLAAENAALRECLKDIDNIAKAAFLPAGWNESIAFQRILDITRLEVTPNEPGAQP